MRPEVLYDIRRVLREAANAPHFFDLSDGDRLNWMIAKGFELGRRQAGDMARCRWHQPREHAAASRPR